MNVRLYIINFKSFKKGYYFKIVKENNFVPFGRLEILKHCTNLYVNKR